VDEAAAEAVAIEELVVEGLVGVVNPVGVVTAIAMKPTDRPRLRRCRESKGEDETAGMVKTKRATFQ